MLMLGYLGDDGALGTRDAAGGHGQMCSRGAGEGVIDVSEGEGPLTFLQCMNDRRYLVGNAEDICVSCKSPGPAVHNPYPLH